eukprot:11159412-Lingulodinium_polyedra.AAC.1
MLGTTSRRSWSRGGTPPHGPDDLPPSPHAVLDVRGPIPYRSGARGPLLPTEHGAWGPLPTRKE